MLIDKFLDLGFGFLYWFIEKLPQVNISFSDIASISSAVTWIGSFVDVEFAWIWVQWLIWFETVLLVPQFLVWLWEKIPGMQSRVSIDEYAGVYADPFDGRPDQVGKVHGYWGQFLHYGEVVATAIIRGVTGFPRSGKTYFVVRQVYRMRLNPRFEGRPVFCNTELLLPAGPAAVQFERIEEIVGAQHAEVVVDECQVLFNAREWKSHGTHYLDWLSQLGKADINLWYTSQDLTNVDAWLRQRTFLSYWVESWKGLGFFTYKSYIGCKEKKDRAYTWGAYLMNPLIADCYHHEHVIHAV